MAEITTIETAGAMLAKLTASLANETATFDELQGAQKTAESLRHMLRLARFDLEWQNRFAELRFRAMARIGAMLAGMDKNKGGRPSEDKPLGAGEGFPTIAELGISHDFSSECQRIARISAEDFDSYVARGTGDDAIELTKSGLFNHEGWESSRRFNAKAKADREAYIIAEAEAAAEAAETREAEPPPNTTEPDKAAQSASSAVSDDEIADTIADEVLEEPEPIPEPPPEPKPPQPIVPVTGNAETMKKALRKALDPAVGKDERDSIIALIQRKDPRADFLDSHVTRDFIDSTKDMVNRHYNESVDYQRRWLQIGERSRKLYEQVLDLQAKLRTAQNKIVTLESRDRERLAVIRQLKAEIERMKVEFSGPGEPASFDPQPTWSDANGDWIRRDIQDKPIGGEDEGEDKQAANQDKPAQASTPKHSRQPASTTTFSRRLTCVLGCGCQYPQVCRKQRRCSAGQQAEKSARIVTPVAAE